MISSRQYGKALALLERYWRTYGALPGIRQFWPYFSHTHTGVTMATTKTKAKTRQRTAKPTTSTTPKIVKQINTLTAQLAELQATADATGAKVDPCATWAVVKPYWSLISRLVLLIPRVGGKISAALTTIGETLDRLCPGASQ